MSNTFGKHFKVTTWGESHGEAIGCVIDGCPPGLEVSEDAIAKALAKRAPGNSFYTSPRQEKDVPKILSGLFEGKTTGAPLSILIENCDKKSEAYTPTKSLLKPGHAQFSYLKKYGIFDFRGSGRASGRETATRVAAGAIASLILKEKNISVFAYLKQVGQAVYKGDTPTDLSSIFTPLSFTLQAEEELKRVIALKDSVGGVVACEIRGCPAGLGEPLFDKITAQLAHAMMGIPAARGFEIGDGFLAASLQGSEHNDAFISTSAGPKPKTNHAGGVLGGITTGETICFNVAFKPTSSIGKEQETTTISGQEAIFSLPEGSRHDPCVAIRAVAVVEAMSCLVIADNICQ